MAITVERASSANVASPERARSVAIMLARTAGLEALYLLKISPAMLLWATGVVLAVSLLPPLAAMGAGALGPLAFIGTLFLLTGLAKARNRATREKMGLEPKG